MPVTWLDVILIVIMLISAFLAMLRGLTREVLSIAAWGAGVGAAFYAYKKHGKAFAAYVQDYVPTPVVAEVGLAAVVFLAALIFATVISILISDRMLDSRIGAVDRTFGFAFGLVRGLLVVVVAYKLYTLIEPKEKMPEWVVTAYSLPMLESTANGLLTLLPDDIDALLKKKERGATPE